MIIYNLLTGFQDASHNVETFFSRDQLRSRLSGSEFEAEVAFGRLYFKEREICEEYKDFSEWQMFNDYENNYLVQVFETELDLGINSNNLPIENYLRCPSSHCDGFLRYVIEEGTSPFYIDSNFRVTPLLSGACYVDRPNHISCTGCKTDYIKGKNGEKFLSNLLEKIDVSALDDVSNYVELALCDLGFARRCS